MYAWVVVFVLPINSALNPVIYTLAAPTELRRRLYKWLRVRLSSLECAPLGPLVDIHRNSGSSMDEKTDRTNSSSLETASGINGSLRDRTGSGSTIAMSSLKVHNGKDNVITLNGKTGTESVKTSILINENGFVKNNHRIYRA